MKKIIKTKCPICGKEHDVILATKKEQEQYTKYLNGMNIQDAFPEYSPDKRELLITGICKDCWDKIFK